MITQRFGTTLLLIAALLAPAMTMAQPVTKTTGARSVWTIEVVDSTSGSHSLGVDTENNPHIAYRDISHDTLKYAYRLDEGWQFDVVAEGGIRESSLAFDHSGLPHIAYCTWDLGSLMSYLRYIFQDDDGWHTETIAMYGQYLFHSPALSFGPDGGPQVVYVASDPSDGGLMYAYRDSEGWHHETVSHELVSQASLDLDADGNPHIAYQSSFALQYAYRDEGGWHFEEINEDEVLGGISLAIDDQDVAHVAYYNFLGKRLNHAFKDGLGWHVETVTDVHRDIQHLDLAISSAPDSDAADQLHISYSDDGSLILKYAYRETTGWRTEVVDGSGQFNTANAIAVDSQGAVYVSYTHYGLGSQELRLAVRPPVAPDPPGLVECYLPLVVSR